MGRFVILLFVIILLSLSWLAHLNNDVVKIAITDNIAYQPLTIELIIISFVSGSIFMFIIFFVNDTRRFIQSRQSQRRQKKREMVNTLYSKAIHFVLGNHIADAVSQLLNAIKEDPNHIPSLLQLGDIYVKTEDYAKAEEYFNHARSIDNENSETLYRIIDLKERTNRLDEALHIIDELIAIEPESINPLLKKQSILEQERKWDELIELDKIFSKKKLSDDERDKVQRSLVGYHYEYGRRSLENNEIEKAEKAFKTVIKMDNTFIPAHLGTAQVMLSENDIEGAVNYLEKLYDQTKSIIFLVRLEDLLISVGEPSRLLRIYRTAATNSPNDIVLKFFMAKLYYRLEMLDDSLGIIDRIDTGVYFENEIRRLKVGILIKRGQYEGAVKEFSKIINMKKAILIPYTCTNCGFESNEWTGRCPSCRQWNTYTFKPRSD
ncbi:MAG: tetratricopeptide repeat protein [Nitrospirae bacterium]|nr:tetratricopeptide repeat protein [Nitrospirota bacterium]